MHFSKLAPISKVGPGLTFWILRYLAKEEPDFEQGTQDNKGCSEVQAKLTQFLINVTYKRYSKSK